MCCQKDLPDPIHRVVGIRVCPVLGELLDLPFPIIPCMAKLPDVLVLGGGIIGLTSAYLLAKAGLRVEVIDRQDFGREASWAGAGILPPFGNPAGARTPIDALRANSVAGFAAFSAELPFENGYRVTGGIEVLHPDSAYCLPLWDAEEIKYERIDIGEWERPEAAAGSPVYSLPGFAQVRNPWHIRALIAACATAGVALTPGCHLKEWKLAHGNVEGVSDSTGRVHQAGQYLIAGGAWAEQWLSPLGCVLGIHPVRGQIVLYHPVKPLLNRVIVDGKRYLVPRGDGRILVGSTEEPEAGFAKATTPAGEEDLCRFAEGWIPALASAEIEQTWAGLRPTSADGLPAIGSVPGFDNVFAAVGHGRAGIQLSLGTARLVLDHLTGRPLPKYAGAFRLDRRPSTDFRPAFRS